MTTMRMEATPMAGTIIVIMVGTNIVITNIASTIIAHTTMVTMAIVATVLSGRT